MSPAEITIHVRIRPLYRPLYRALFRLTVLWLRSRSRRGLAIEPHATKAADFLARHFVRFEVAP